MAIFGNFWEFPLILGSSDFENQFGFFKRFWAIFWQFCAIFVAILRNFGDYIGNSDQFLVFGTFSMILSTQKLGYLNWRFLEIFGNFFAIFGNFH